MKEERRRQVASCTKSRSTNGCSSSSNTGSTASNSCCCVSCWLFWGCVWGRIIKQFLTKTHPICLLKPHTISSSSHNNNNFQLHEVFFGNGFSRCCWRLITKRQIESETLASRGGNYFGPKEEILCCGCAATALSKVASESET